MQEVMEAAFAQTPVSGYTPSGSNSYYDLSHPAQTRARAHYGYDSGGRLTSLEHYWDTRNGGVYVSEAILRNSCDYELTGLNRGLKTASKLWTRASVGSPNWVLGQTDTYSYDSSLDYLVGASYGDGYANATPTWTYDAAGNRNDATCDNLNRATSVNGLACTNDILGNRLTKGSDTFGWDVLNRMTSYNANTYQYRADGMRTKKVVGSATTTYRYDGQMGMQDVVLDGATTTITNYALGARGIDAISTTTNGGTAVVTYPLYDAHGNMISTLSKSGSGYTYSALRDFDAWGVIRSANGTGDPKGRYCASIGHKQDDESGLIYMRARYYEPSSGRFVSEDAAMQGLNWFSYCLNDPVNKIDESGHTAIDFVKALLQAVLFIGGEILLDMWTDASNQVYKLTSWISQLESLIKAGNLAGGATGDLAAMKDELKMAEGLLSRAKFIKTGQIILKLIGYMMIIKAFLMDIDFVDERSGLDIILGN